MALSNLLILNNVVRNVTNGINIIGAGTCTNVDVVNNSFYGGLNGVSIPGTLATGKIVNNAFNGNTSAGTGISVGTVSSSVIDYNVVFGYTSAYGGAASGGGSSYTTNPLFVSSTDLRVQQGSDCVDRGVGSGTYTEVPATDVRADSRPALVGGYVAKDNGTDIGAYEMRVAELPPNIYYINASGTNVPPYSSVATGALNITTLKANVILGGRDIIEVVDDGVINDTAEIHLYKGVTFRSYSGNTNKPTFNLYNTGRCILLHGPFSDLKFQNLKLTKAGPSAHGMFIAFEDSGTFDSFEFTGNEVYVVDTTSMTDGARVIHGQSCDFTNALVEDNIFHDVSTGLFFPSGFSDSSINNNTIYNMTKTSAWGIHLSGTISNTIVEKNTIYNVTDAGIYISASSTNVDVKNNVVRDIFNGHGILFQAPVSSCSVVNNSIRNCFVNGITFGNGGGVNSVVVNNIVQGAGIVGIALNAQSSCKFEYNSTFDCTTDNTRTGGVADSGTNMKGIDPLFVSATNLKLQSRSPAIDSGVDSGTYSQIPATDIRNQARPVVISGYYPVTNGTDMGAYEMLASEAPMIAATYYVDAGGSNTVPYDTIEKAAPTLGNLFYGDGVVPADAKVSFFPVDVAEVVAAGGTIVETNLGPSGLPNYLTVRSYSGNATRPVVQLGKGHHYIGSCVGFSFTNIDFIKNPSGGGPTTGSFVSFNGASGCSVEKCSFSYTDDTPSGGWIAVPTLSINNAPNTKYINNIAYGMPAYFIGMNGTSPNCQILNNSTYDLYMASAGGGGTIGMIYVDNTTNRSAGTIIANNIIHSTNPLGTLSGIFIAGVNLTANYNNIFGMANTYGGVATAGSFDKITDPLYTDPDNGVLTLTLESPGLDQGAGVGIYANVPTTDFIGAVRPIQGSEEADADDGTDMGAYEMARFNEDDEDDGPNNVRGQYQFGRFPGLGVGRGNGRGGPRYSYTIITDTDPATGRPIRTRHRYRSEGD